MAEDLIDALSYHSCAILCPARMPAVCRLNLYRELRRPGSTPVRASVWMSRWQYWAHQSKTRRKQVAGQLEMEFNQP